MRSIRFDGEVKGTCQLPQIISAGPVFDEEGRAYFTAMVSADWTARPPEYESWLLAAVPGGKMLWQKKLEHQIPSGNSLRVVDEELWLHTPGRWQRYTLDGKLIAIDESPNIRLLTRRLEDGSLLTVERTTVALNVQRTDTDGAVSWSLAFPHSEVQSTGLAGVEQVGGRLYIAINEGKPLPASKQARSLETVQQTGRLLCLEPDTGAQNWEWRCKDGLGALRLAPDGTFRALSATRPLGGSVLYALNP